MPVTLKVAFRNIFEHKAKSLIIGILLALGAFVLVVGNGFIDASRAGIRTSFTDNYTGDVFISGISDEGDVSLFGVPAVGGLAPTPIIPDYDKVMQIVLAAPQVAEATGMATSYGIVTRPDGLARPAQTEEDGDPAARFLFMFGVETPKYWQVFDSIELVSGSLLQPGQQGLIVNAVQLEKLSKWMGKDLGVGDSLVIQGISSSGFKIREIPIVGTYKQRGDGAMPEQLSFVDIDTLRVMAGMTVGTNETVDLAPAQTAMLGVDDVTSLFGGDLFESAPSYSSFDENKLAQELSATQARTLANTADTGAWQFIVVRTHSPNEAASLVKSLNKSFSEQGLAVVAGDWQKAAGPYGQSVDVVRIVFTIAIFVLAIVAIIIIMNTFVISVIERTGEIGTMRAIGAEKGFIRKLFAAEAAVLSLTFSVIGSILGAIFVSVLRSLRIVAGNPFLEVLFGGKYLSPFVTPVNFIAAILAMVVVGYLAHLYPVSVALKIQPVQAMQHE